MFFCDKKIISKMKKIIIILFLVSPFNSSSQEILGYWKTLDSKTNEINSVVEIYKENNQYFGKIVAIIKQDYKGYCDTCIGKYKDKDLVNIVILKDFDKINNTYENGKITDPENGKIYSSYLKLITKEKLKIRGYIGLSMFGRTEYWYRLNKDEKIILKNKLKL